MALVEFHLQASLPQLPWYFGFVIAVVMFSEMRQNTYFCPSASWSYIFTFSKHWFEISNDSFAHWLDFFLNSLHPAQKLTVHYVYTWFINLISKKKFKIICSRKWLAILLIKEHLPFLSIQGFKPWISTPFSFEFLVVCFLVDVLQYILRWHDTWSLMNPIIL